MKFVKRPITVEATQWHQNGDHPKDESCEIIGDDGIRFMSEGKVVRRFRHPAIPGEILCDKCGKTYHIHGYMEQPNYTGVVCPGDWIITELDNKGFYPCTNNAFKQIYLPATEGSVTLTSQKYMELLEKENFLMALNRAGVQGWDGCEEAEDKFKEMSLSVEEGQNG